MSFSVCQDLNRITSFIGGSWVDPKFYTRMMSFFHSTEINLDQLTSLWGPLCLKFFSASLVKFNGKYIVLEDGLKIPKEGKKMPGIKSHHQGSQNNSKPEYIKWHCDGWKLLFLQANDKGTFGKWKSPHYQNEVQCSGL